MVDASKQELLRVFFHAFVFFLVVGLVQQSEE